MPPFESLYHNGAGREVAHAILYTLFTIGRLEYFFYFLPLFCKRMIAILKWVL
jgi:hypothetical protein